MKLLGEPGTLVAQEPAVARTLNLALACGGAAGALNVAGMALLAAAVAPLLQVAQLSQAVPLALAASVGALLLAFFLRQQAEARAHAASYRLEVALRERLIDHLARLPLGVVQGWGSGRVRKILQDDVKALHIAVADAVPFIGAGLSQPLAALLLLALVQWRLALAALVMLPVSVACMALMARQQPQQRARYSEAGEAVNAGVIELVQGMAVMRTFDNGEVGWRRFTGRLNQFTDAVEAWMAASRLPWKINRAAGAALPTAGAILAVGCLLYAAGQVTLAEWLLAMTIGTLPVKALEPLMHLANYLSDAGAASRRIREVLAQPALPEPEIPQPPQGHALRLENVSFCYPGRTAPALSDITLSLAPGTRCAIVGASGSGKSTLARLIPRFYDVSSGRITLGGCDIREMRSDALLRQMALVLQEPFLIGGTLEENLRLARPDASDAELQAVMDACGVTAIIDALPDGLQTAVSERGGSLSGGQRQRITLARALLANAPLLIMDEVTSYLDAHSDRLVQRALAQLAPHTTQIVIAHRLHAVVDADLIVVMDAGRIVEQGRHADLLAQEGRYARLWQHYRQTRRWTLRRERDQCRERDQ